MAAFNTGTTANIQGQPHTTAFTATLPAGVATGDVMVAFVTLFTFDQASGTPGISTPTSGGGNWTQASFTTSGSSGGLDVYSAVFWRVATAGDASSTLSMSWTGGTPNTDQLWWTLAMGSYTGFYTAGTPIVVTSSTGVNSAGATLTAPSTTTTVANSWALQAECPAVNGSGNISSTPATQREIGNDGAGIDCAFSDSNASVGSAGTAIGGGTFTNASTNGWWVTWTVELLTQAPGGAPTTALATMPQIPHPLWHELLEVAYSRSDWQAQGVASLAAFHWRLMDGVNGRPGIGSTGTQPPATATGSGTNTYGTLFYPNQSGMWLEGYWWYVCPAGGQSTSPQQFCTWACVSAGGTVVPGSAVTSGTLATGWNWIPLPQPVQLSIWGQYEALTGLTGTAPATTAQTNSGGPYQAGIVNGPLSAFSDGNGSNPPPYGFGNGATLATSTTDPAVPANQAGGDGDAGNLYWLDVQVTNIAPASYSGSYRLWPNISDADLNTVDDAAVNYVVGTEVVLSQPCVVNAIWYYRPNTTTQFATSADIWRTSDGVRVATQPNPTWILAAGGKAPSGGGQWVKCELPSTVTLAPGSYRVSVYNGNGSPDAWSAKRLFYWESGDPGFGPATANFQNSPPGQNGITNGPLYAPPTPLASPAVDFTTGQPEPGQSVFATGPPNQFPNTYVGNGPTVTTALFQNYWVDLEVTPASTFQPDTPVLPQSIGHPLWNQLVEIIAEQRMGGNAPAAAGQTVALPVAQETISALAPTIAESLALALAQETIAAPAPAIAASISLAVAQETINALTPTIAEQLALAVAQETINALAPSVSEALGLPVAGVTINAPAPTLSEQVNLAVAQVNINAPAPAISTGTSVALSLASESINAPTPSLSEQLALPVATVSINAPAPAPAVGVTVSLTVASESVSARTPGIGLQLTLSVASESISAHALVIGPATPPLSVGAGGKVSKAEYGGKVSRDARGGTVTRNVYGGKVS